MIETRLIASLRKDVAMQRLYKYTKPGWLFKYIENFPMLNIYFIRHCKTDYTPEGMLRDQKHLSQEGRQQAIELKKKLQESEIDFDAIYTSNMMRGMETVIPYALEENKKIISRRVLREMKIVGRLHDLYDKSKTNPKFKFPGWESLIEARDRYIHAIDRIIKKHSSGKVIVVTHWAIFREYLKYYFPNDPIEQLIISNPDVYRVQILDNKIISYDKVEELIPNNAVVRSHS